MNSRNGVFINGQKIEGETLLAEDDRIKIGDTELLFTTEDFQDSESALHHFKKAGERARPTFLGSAFGSKA
jgi:pSer/pThr/pTyr-binding forkhead associated (FHA) protein